MTEREGFKEDLPGEAQALRTPGGEATYRDLVETSNDLIWSVDVEGRFTFVNRQAARTLLGREPEELLGRPFTDFQTPEQARKDRETHAARLRDGEPSLRYETCLLRKDGAQVALTANVVAVRDKAGNVAGFIGTFTDVTARRRTERLERAQRHFLELVATGKPLPEVMDFLTRFIEGESGEALCSILLLDPHTNRLRHGAAPSLPDAFNRAVDGLAVGPCNGCCGTAVFRKETVTVTDVHADPLCTDYRELAQTYGLRACTSVPVLSSTGEVLGTFAMYYRTARGPSPREADLMRASGQLLSIAIERRRAEDALAEATDRLREAQAIAHVGNFYESTAGRLVWSEELYRVYGLDPHKVQPSLENFLALVPPDHQDQVLRNVRQASENRLPFEHELPIVRPDGQVRWLFARGEPVVSAAGEMIGLKGICQDVTERKAAEEKLRASERRYATTLRGIADGVIATDAAGRVTFLNPAAEALTGWPLAEAVGRPAGEVFPTVNEFTRAKVEIPPARVPREGVTAGLGGRTLLLARDGKERLLDACAAPLHDDQDRPAGAVLVFRDITEARRVEEQLRQSQRMEAIGKLAAGVAHDFNNLLTVINGFSGLLLSAMAEDHPWRGFTTEILKAGERAATLTHQLLAFSRKQMLQPKVLDLNRVVAGMERMLRRLIGENVRVQTRLDPALRAVRADPGQVEQVILNLAVNARDAMPHGGTLTLATAPATFPEGATRPLPEMPPGSYQTLAVTDTGCGMDEAVLARVFEPFFTTKPVGKGTGMGLATVFGIVKQSGGHVTVASAVGQGSTFTIYLPTASEEPDPNPSALQLPDLPQGRETVLLVEDEEGVRALACQVLRSCGYTVLEARHGVEALQVGGRYTGPLDLLVTDVMMPLMSSGELVARLNARRPGLKVLFISGYNDSVLIRQGLQHGERNYLQKPFTPDALARKVREVLDQ